MNADSFDFLGFFDEKKNKCKAFAFFYENNY